MCQSVWIIISLLLCSMACVSATEVMVLDDFEYADERAAQAAWQAAEGSEPVGLMPSDQSGGEMALQMRCNFTRGDLRRAVYDRNVDLDLTRCGTICFDLYGDESSVVGHFTIYFRSGAGWYAGQVGGLRKGWQQVRLAKGGFRTEGTPAGWYHIDRIRLSAWKAAAKDSFCAVDNLRAVSESVVVVLGSNTKGAELRAAHLAADTIYSHLTGVGLSVGLIDQGDVEQGALAGRKLAIFAYSPNPSEAELSQIEAFVNQGGRIIVFYTASDRVAKLLGIRRAGWKRAEPRGEFQGVVFRAPDVVGLPATMRQDSWNVVLPEPTGKNARVIGVWRDAEGNEGPPAVLLSDTGAYMGHILLSGDTENKRLFLLAVVGHLLPEAWEEAGARALEPTVRIGRFGDRASLERFLNSSAPETGHEAEVKAILEAARTAEAQARHMLAEKRYPDVLAAAASVRGALADAYALCQVSRDGEFRAVWNHSGTGDCGTWEEAMRRLAAANFNAVVPNMWWAGVAHYDSKLLPHSETFLQKGDQIAQAVAAGKKYGIEVHPWKVNWNLSNAPQEFKDQMRAAGRTQKNHTGEDIDWLCPSHPENFELELEPILEVALNYDVAGIHFDYIRYPHGDSCYCDGCRERFEQYHGTPVETWPEECYSGPLREEYRNWRSEQINRLVRATAEEVRRVKPHVKISAAVFGSYPGCRDSVGQDWVRWVKEGWVDFICPMDYTGSDDRFQQLVARQVGLVGGRIPIYTGIGASSSSSQLSPDRVIGQIEISRAQGADGFIVFNMGEALTMTTFPQLAKAITSGKAVLPHNAPGIDFKFPTKSDTPVLAPEDDSLAVEVTVTSWGHHALKATGATGTVELQDVQGHSVADLGALPPLTQEIAVRVGRHGGVLRLAAVGELTFADGTRKRFIRRSRPFAFLTD